MQIPDQIRGNALAKILDDFRSKYGSLSRTGRLMGLVIADQDAKVLAVNSFFEAKINYWDVGAIGAALYGVAKQGKDFFDAKDLEKAVMVYQNVQFFVQNIGSVKLTNSRERELILILIADKELNIGLAMMQLKNFAPRIKQQVEDDEKSQQAMQMSETEFMQHINELKKELFNLAS
jgi:predicted regulator of Ras-like GTPase activity (Roadblock/LC7/MglB family)